MEPIETKIVSFKLRHDAKNWELADGILKIHFQGATLTFDTTKIDTTLFSKADEPVEIFLKVPLCLR